MSGWQLAISGLVWMVALTVVCWVWGTKIVEACINQVLDRYEERVHRQTLAQARQLVDANREHMVRPDGDAPARIHKAHLGRKHKDDW